MTERLTFFTFQQQSPAPTKPPLPGYLELPTVKAEMKYPSQALGLPVSPLKFTYLQSSGMANLII